MRTFPIHLPFLFASLFVCGAFAALYIHRSTDAHAAERSYTPSYEYQEYYPLADSSTSIAWGSLDPNPAYGAPGEPITITGITFPRNASVRIYFDSTYAGSATADGAGRFQTVVSVPNLPEGLVSVTASNADPYNPPRFYVNPVSSQDYRDQNPPQYRPPHSSTIADLQDRIDDLEDRLDTAQSRLNRCLDR
jgi:hypothetical protein